jgi:lysophospholipase L1-like esterase
VVADGNPAFRGVYVREGVVWVKKLDLPVDAVQALLDQTKNARDLALNYSAASAAAKIAAEAARDIAAGYASDAVSQGNVPIYSTVSGMPGLSIPQGIRSVRVNGFTSAGDNGGGLYVRATSQPVGEYASLAFRTADRFLPDGSTSAGNGGWWAWKEKFNMRDACKKVAAKLAKGERTVIACYGDSTTDGNNTSGWSENPTTGGNAVGTTDHMLLAPNAWPARLKWALENYYRIEDFKVMNCGYSGKRMDDGWAVSNFQAGVVQNCLTIAGGLPDVVIIGFGHNDSTVSDTDPDWIANHLSESRKLCRLAMSFGIVPILQTCDPSWRSDPATYDSDKTTMMLDAAKEALATELGVMLMDTGGDLKRWMNNNKDDHNYIENQSDGLHGGDIWCAFKGPAAARFFMRDFITRPGAIGPQRVSGSDSAMQNPLPREAMFQMKQSRDGACYTTGHTEGLAAPLGLAADLWIWNEDPDAEVFYRGVSNENLSAADLAAYTKPYHQIFDLPNIKDRGSRIPAGLGFVSSGHGRRCDVPYRIGKLAFGMNRIRYRVDSLPFWFLGHYEIRTTPDWAAEAKGVSASPYSAGVPLNALRGTGKFLLEVSKAAAGQTVSFVPEAADMSNVVGLMNSDRARLFLRAAIPQNTGVILGWTRSYSSTTGQRDNKSFLLLYKSGATSVQFYLGSVVDGAVTFSALGSAGTITQTADAEGGEKYLIYLSNDANNLNLILYEGWDFTAPTLITVSAAPDTLAPPPGFVMGGLFVNVSPSGSGYFNPKILDYFGRQQTIIPGVPEPSTVAS